MEFTLAHRSPLMNPTELSLGGLLRSRARPGFARRRLMQHYRGARVKTLKGEGRLRRATSSVPYRTAKMFLSRRSGFFFGVAYDRWVWFDRFSPGKSTLGLLGSASLRPGPASSSVRRFFSEARASVSELSSVKWPAFMSRWPRRRGDALKKLGGDIVSRPPFAIDRADAGVEGRRDSSIRRSFRRCA